MQVEILRLDHNGRGIGKIDGKTVFVPNALPGEIVTLKNIVDKKRYMEAEVEEYLQTSSKRVNPICPYFGICGGCDLMHLSHQDQLHYKQDKVRDMMERYAKIDTNIIKPIVSCNELAYRNKVTFHVREKCGFFAKKSYEVVPIDHCFLMDDEMNSVFELIKKEIPLEVISTFVLRHSIRRGEMMVLFTLKESKDLLPYVETLKKQVTSIYAYYDGQYHLLYGKKYMSEQLQDFVFDISPSAFFQVNTVVAEKMYEQARKYLNPSKEDILLDLYCGTGTIGLTMSPYVSRVIGVEVNESSVQDANRNKERNGISNAIFYHAKVSDVIEDLDGALVVVDPPRAGLDTKTIQELKKIKPKRMTYISCDPMTLARDLKLLASDFEVVEITPFDMFPETDDVENVVLLKRK